MWTLYHILLVCKACQNVERHAREGTVSVFGFKDFKCLARNNYLNLDDRARDKWYGIIPCPDCLQDGEARPGCYYCKAE